MSQNKFQPCRLCGTSTPAVVNINFKAVPICESCCGAIFIQQAQWYVQQDFSHLYKPQLTAEEQVVMNQLNRGEHWEIYKGVVTSKIDKSRSLHSIGFTKDGVKQSSDAPVISDKILKSLIKKGLIRQYSESKSGSYSYTYYKKI